MKSTIKKGKHRPWFPRIRLYFCQTFVWKRRFDESIIYDIGAYQLDIQKLVGIRYFKGDHSARFGFAYDPLNPGGVWIFAYVHDKDFITKDDKQVILGRVGIKELFTMKLIVEDNHYEFYLNNLPPAVIPKTHDQWLSFGQGFFFESGEKPNLIAAPHDITVYNN